MKLSSVIAIAALAAIATSAHASTNLLTNGSFENGFTGWTLSGTTGDGYPESVITYNNSAPYPTGAFNESVPADTFSTASPDAAGTHAAYFVSDEANELLTQTVSLVAGRSYTAGFDYYAPFNGSANNGDALLTGFINGVGSTMLNLGTVTPGAWNEFTYAFTATASGPTQAGFEFEAANVPSKDIVIDRAFITSAVPEPSSWIMMLGGIALMGAALRFGRKRGVIALAV